MDGKGWVYPYNEEARTGANHMGKPLLRPTVPVRVGADTAIHVALVDSGADNILAPEWIARAAGVEPDAAREQRVRIGGRSQTIRFQEVVLEICPPAAARAGHWEGAGVQWEAHVGFFMNWSDPPWLVILGQCGFFDHFTVTMSRYSQCVAVQPRDHFADHYGVPTV